METTIKDIAKEAGVSKSTVSRVLSNSGKYSVEAERKVLAAAKKLDYKKNSLARAMITKETKNLGLILYQKHKPILSHPFYAPVIEAIVDSSRELGYSIIIATDQDIKASSVELLLEKRVDGIIFASFVDPSIVLKYKSLGIPLVLVNNSVEFKGVSYVKVNNYSGAFDVIDHLAKKGHRNIAFLCGPLHHKSYKERYEGYLAALKHHGIDKKEEYIRVGDSTLCDGQRMMGEVLTLGKLPTAVFASNDMMAIGAMKEIKRRGLKIPYDIAVAGFDNIEFGNLMEPSLTTVSTDKNLMGQKVVELLIHEIKKIQDFKRGNVIPTTLVIREST